MLNITSVQFQNHAWVAIFLEMASVLRIMKAYCVEAACQRPVVFSTLVVPAEHYRDHDVAQILVDFPPVPLLLLSQEQWVAEAESTQPLLSHRCH